MQESGWIQVQRCMWVAERSTGTGTSVGAGTGTGSDLVTLGT